MIVENTHASKKPAHDENVKIPQQMYAMIFKLN